MEKEKSEEKKGITVEKLKPLGTIIGLDSPVRFATEEEMKEPFKIEDDSDFSRPQQDIKFNYNSPLENKDEDLIEGKNKVKINFGKETMSVRIDTKFNWWKEQLFLIIRFDDSTVIERIKIILGEEAWDRIEKEYKKWQKN